MRIVFKILAAPFVVVLSVLWVVLAFLFGVLEGLLQYVSGLIALGATILLFMGSTKEAAVVILVAFLLSPFGLPKIADWLIELVAALNDSLKDFIMA